MKWILKIAAAVIGAVLLVGGGVVCWYYRQATALPEWYAEEVARQEERTLEEEHTDLPDPQWEDAVVLDEPEEAEEEDDDDAPEAAPRTQKVLRGFHRRGKGKSTKAVRASRATYRGGKLEAGVVLDLSQIPRDNLSEHDRDLLERAATNFPGIAKRNVYVGIEDHPVAVDGVLQLGSEPTIRIGRLRYSLPTAAGRLGMAPATLRAELDRELRRLHLTDPADP
jgi:hypothetical protein